MRGAVFDLGSASIDRHLRRLVPFLLLGDQKSSNKGNNPSMMDGVNKVHARADMALAGGVCLLVLSLAPVIGSNLYTERHVAPPAAAVPRPAIVELAAEQPAPKVVGPSAVELAAAHFAAESQCLAEVMYYEARGEGKDGQKAVAEVVLHRTHHKTYATTVCGVAHEGGRSGKAGCQFSFACDGSLDRKREGRAWKEARLLADRIMAGEIVLTNQTRDAIAFHSVGVAPAWKDFMIVTGQIGNHIFYREMPKEQQLAQAALKQAGGAILAAE